MKNFLFFELSVLRKNLITYKETNIKTNFSLVKPSQVLKRNVTEIDTRK